MNIRTDLIAESCESNQKAVTGISENTEHIGDVTLSTVNITDDAAAKAVQKPIGKYCTVEFPPLERVLKSEDIVSAVINALKSLTPKNFKSALVVGLGNTDITPDAIGPLTVNRILATRHLSIPLRKTLGLENLRDVSCITPSVLGKTGIESYDIITATADKIKPSLIIAVDALAARSPARLCKTVQLSNSGISPGAGVNNSRKELSENTIGIPVVAVGIPTVIDANHLFDSNENMMVTPKEIDMLVEKSADILSKAINLFLQPSLDSETIESLT